MKRIFSFMFIMCLTLTSVMFFACKEKGDYLYKVNGIEIESVEIEKNNTDFIFEIELENKTNENKVFDFTLIKLKVDDNNQKTIVANNFNKQTINAKAEKEFSFILDEEDVNVYGVTIGTSVSVYYADVKIATIVVED